MRAGIALALHVCMALHGQSIVPELPHLQAVTSLPSCVTQVWLAPAHVTQAMSELPFFTPLMKTVLTSIIYISKRAKYPGAYRSRQGVVYPSFQSSGSVMAPCTTGSLNVHTFNLRPSTSSALRLASDH